VTKYHDQVYTTYSLYYEVPGLNLSPDWLSRLLFLVVSNTSSAFHYLLSSYHWTPYSV